MGLFHFNKRSAYTTEYLVVSTYTYNQVFRGMWSGTRLFLCMWSEFRCPVSPLEHCPNVLCVNRPFLQALTAGGGAGARQLLLSLHPASNSGALCGATSPQITALPPPPPTHSGPLALFLPEDPSVYLSCIGTSPLFMLPGVSASRRHRRQVMNSPRRSSEVRFSPSGKHLGTFPQPRTRVVIPPLLG